MNEPICLSREIIIGERVMVVNTDRQAKKAEPVNAIGEMDLAVKGVEEDDGVLICIASKAGVFDRERERMTLPALKAATLQLIKNIGLGRVEIDICHSETAIKADLQMAWLGWPMPDPQSLYVCIKPADPAIVDLARKGHLAGMSWSGGYKLKDSVFP